MKTIRTVLRAGCFLAMGLIVPSLHAQNFTFTTIAGIAGAPGGAADGTNTAAQFSKPAGVAVDGSGNIYVADYLNNAIRKITPSGTNWIVTTIAGGTSGDLDGTNSNAQFSGPTGIALDSATNLYVSDQLNYTIRKIAPSGTNWVVTTIAGQARVHGARDGANTNALFYNPFGIAVDTNGNIFVADEFNNTIRKITPAGTNWIVSTIAGQTNAGSQDGTNTAAQFSGPAGIAVDANDHLFVADQFNNTMRLLTPEGTNWVVTTLAGQLNAGAENGLGANAQFNSPVGVALDTNGNVYVADLFNNAIREMTTSGINWSVSTIGGGSQGHSNGIGTNAQFSLPFGVTTDVYGDVFVADYENNAIRMGISSSSAPQTGSLEVTLTPSNAVTAGVEWQLDGGPLQPSGQTLSGLAPGIHAIAFSTNSGYTTPADQTVTVTAHQETTATGNYFTGPGYTITLSALPAAGGAVHGGGTFAAGSSNIVTATADSGYEFVDWTENGSVTSTSSSYTVILGSNMTLVANFLLTNITQSYALTVSALPNSDGTVSAGGTNGGGMFPQDSTNTVMATPNSGFEFIGWAGDATGTINPLTVTMNTNLNITAYFAPTGSITFTVLIIGDGTVSPELNGVDLKAARNYTLTAKPGSGYVFAGWTGSIATNKNPLTIRAGSSLLVQANFVPNPFLPFKGIYNGLFMTTNGVTEQTAGMLRGLTVSVKGTYSGTPLINGASHALSGSFDAAGLASNHVARAASQGGPLSVEMTLYSSNNIAPRVTGTVSGTANDTPWVADLIADLATNTLLSAEYTMLITPGTNTSLPGGDGYVLITNYAGTAKNPAAATVKITGALADGTAFNQTAPVSQDGYVPVYANLYASKGLLLGWINLNLTNTTGVSLTWIHPASASGLYVQGFSNYIPASALLLSPWTDPPANIIDLLTNLSTFDNINDTNTLLSFPVTISSSGEIGPKPLIGSINPKTGLLKLTIGSGESKMTGSGAILLNGTNGGGYCLTKTAAQAIALGP